MLDKRRRRALERLAREAGWLREFARAAQSAPVDFVAVQVLAAMAIESSPTFEAVRSRLNLTKPQLSRALRSLRSEGLVEQLEGRYARDALPAVTGDGFGLLQTLVDQIDLT